MEAYSSFAEVYDRLQDTEMYDAWTEWIHGKLQEEGIMDGLVLDLACGTGAMTRRLSKKGYDMIGIDLSGECLAIAAEREEGDVLYLQQDMRAFELYGTVRAVILCCDSINYLTELTDVEQVFRLVNNYLDPGGLLILDFHPPFYYREILGDRSITDVDEDLILIWENEELPEGMHEMDLCIMEREEDGRYRRTEETHFQRGYSMEEMKAAAEKAGLTDIQFYADYTSETIIPETTERIVMTAREQGKCEGLR